MNVLMSAEQAPQHKCTRSSRISGCPVWHHPNRIWSLYMNVLIYRYPSHDCSALIRNRTNTHKIQSPQNITIFSRKMIYWRIYFCISDVCLVIRKRDTRHRNDPMLHQNYVTLSFTNTSAYIHLYGIHCRTATLPHLLYYFLYTDTYRTRYRSTHSTFIYIHKIDILREKYVLHIFSFVLWINLFWK